MRVLYKKYLTLKLENRQNDRTGRSKQQALILNRKKSSYEQLRFRLGSFMLKIEKVESRTPELNYCVNLSSCFSQSICGGEEGNRDCCKNANLTVLQKYTLR